MKAPQPLRESRPDEGTVEGAAADLVRRGREVRPAGAAESARTLRRIEESAAGRRAGWRWPAVAAVLAAATCAAIVIATRGAPAPGWESELAQLSADPGDPIRASAGAEIRVTSEAGEARVQLARGRIFGRAGATPFQVVAPGMRVQVAGARFQVAVDGAFATLTVDEGAAQASASGPTVTVRAHESLRSDDPRLAKPVVAAAEGRAPAAVGPARVSPAKIAPAKATARAAAGVAGSAPHPAVVKVAPRPARTPHARAAEAAGCDRAADRRGCLEKIAAGGGLAAENALYALGLYDRDQAGDGTAAILDWRSYERRFPGGALAPEAAAAILDQLVSDRRYAEAEREASAYRARFAPAGGDRRAIEIALVRAHLLREQLDRPADALAAYRAVLDEAKAPSHGRPSSARGEALFGAALAAQSLGLADEARRDAAAYREEFPAGRHAEALAPLAR